MEVEVWEGMTEGDIGRSREEIVSDVTRQNAGTRFEDNMKDCTMSLDNKKENPTLPLGTSEDISSYTIGPRDIPYSKLKEMIDPERFGIDPSKKELALSNTEFLKIFKMDKESFAKLAEWKKTRMKKDASLF